VKKIFLHEPHFLGKEISYVKSCIKSGWVSTSGKFVQEFEKKISNFTKSKFSIALNSGTSALDLCLKSIFVKPGDEILIPTITFIAPVNSILYNGCKPIFMDCDNLGNIDLEKVLDFIENETIKKKNYTINKKTKKKIKAIIIVHVFGNTVKLNKIKKICKTQNIKIIEDASESFGSYVKIANKNLKHTGTLGDMGCFSFNANKIITTGAGGAVITGSKKIHKTISYLSTQAKDDPINFIHNEVGYNMKLNNLSASVGLAQIQTFSKITKRKKYIHDYYKKKLLNSKYFKILSPPKNSKCNFWINLLSIKNTQSIKTRDFVINKFFKNKIQVRPVWFPNHLQKKMKNFQRFKLFNYNNFLQSTICLPSGHNLDNKSLDRVINVINLLEKDKKFLNTYN
tara:strand:+ start:463 stop:1656 length:1194 start_codon:yes stop_codon:yes gene_type:complete